MYNNAKSLLENEKCPELYSLDMETDNDIYLRTENPIKRFYMYKSGNVDKQSVYKGAVRYRELNESICHSIVDCDSCDLIKDVYRLLWAEAIADSDNSTIDGQHGDTMTSLQHSLNLAVELIETDDERKQYFKGRKVSLAYQIELLCCVDDFLSRASNIRGFEAFARMYHTIGNMIPVPPMFNSLRSNFGSNDYWDITLTKIKAWYDTHNNFVLAVLLHKINVNDKAVELCAKWLSWYDNWLNFIDKNYLNDYIDSKTFEPVRFRPDSSDDVEAFFEKCSALIEKRGKRIVKELKKRI